MNFEDKVYRTISKYSMLAHGDTVVIGLSGGADSVALFRCLCALRERLGLTLHAAHINHMIRGDEARRDAVYAEELARGAGVEFHLLESNIPQIASELGISEEMAGRQVRYEFFASIIGDNGKIAVAHHKGDSVETTLINMIRGSSLKGLKGISPVNGNIIRPLIECERSEIEAYLAAEGVGYMNDSTNEQNIYTRNIVRNIIIPAMSELNPGIIPTIYDNSVLLGDDEDFIASVCRDFESKFIQSSEGCITLDFSAGGDIHIALRRRLAMRCCELLAGERRGISSAHIDNILSLPTGGKTSFHGIHAENSYGRYIFTRHEADAPDFCYTVDVPSILHIEETGESYRFDIVNVTDIRQYESGVLYLDADKLGTFTVRSRRDGDIFTPLGMNGRKKIKDYLIDCKIPRRERDALPILETGGKIAAILCQRADDAYKVTPHTLKILTIRKV